LWWKLWFYVYIFMLGTGCYSSGCLGLFSFITIFVLNCWVLFLWFIRSGPFPPTAVLYFILLIKTCPVFFFLFFKDIYYYWKMFSLYVFFYIYQWWYLSRIFFYVLMINIDPAIFYSSMKTICHVFLYQWWIFLLCFFLIFFNNKFLSCAFFNTIFSNKIFVSYFLCMWNKY